MPRQRRQVVAHQSHLGEHWYNVEIVVDLLIGELPRGHDHAAEIANLCVGFFRLTRELLWEELQDMRDHWPEIFPSKFSTSELLGLIEEKYPIYERMAATVGGQ